MKSRDLLIICVALVVSVAVALGTRYILHGGSGTTANLTKVMVAASDLSIGKKIEEGSFRWQDWPSETVQPVYIVQDDEAGLQKAMGAMVVERINAGEPILKAALASDKGYLSAMLEQGMRAFTIPLDTKSNISGKVLPGDYVDVIVALRSKDKAVASTVVSGAKVIEINDVIDAKEAKDAAHPKPSDITIQVSPRQAEALAAALKDGTPVISLHPVGSSGTPEPEPVVEQTTAPTQPDSSVTITRGSESQKVQLKG